MLLLFSTRGILKFSHFRGTFKRKKKKTFTDGGISIKETQDWIKGPPNGQNWNNLNKINKIELDYTPKYKINISEFI